MSKADEMFEELGYKKYDNHPEHDLPPEPNMWSTQDCRQLYYEQTGVIENGRIGREIIYLDLFRKNVVCCAFIDNKRTPVPLNMKELQAINEKCKELGWI